MSSMIVILFKRVSRKIESPIRPRNSAVRTIRTMRTTCGIRNGLAAASSSQSSRTSVEPERGVTARTAPARSATLGLLFERSVAPTQRRARGWPRHCAGDLRQHLEKIRQPEAVAHREMRRHQHQGEIAIGGGRAHSLSEVMRTSLKEPVKNDQPAPAASTRSTGPRRRPQRGGSAENR